MPEVPSYEEIVSVHVIHAFAYRLLPEPFITLMVSRTSPWLWQD